MRLNYKTETVEFPRDRMLTRIQTPKQIVVHRQGNPGVEGANGMRWMARTGAASIHYYVDDDTVYNGIPVDRHAFHVSEPRLVTGRITYGLYGRRGDYDTIGIECEDESPTSAALAPGQKYGLSRETRISLVILLATLCYRHKLTPDDIIFHSTLDPWTRPEDPGDALNLVDLRRDVTDLLASRTPWRTVGVYATGMQATTPGQVIANPASVPVPSDRPTVPTLTADQKVDVFTRLFRYVNSGGTDADRVNHVVGTDRVTFTVLR